jgi:hypothetical protein
MPYCIDLVYIDKLDIGGECGNEGGARISEYAIWMIGGQPEEPVGT